MARIRQFAKDMGLSYNKAKNLVNKGRKLRDGGSSVLESTMNKVKPIKASKGKVTNFGGKKNINIGKAKTGQLKNIANATKKGEITVEEALKKTQALVRRKNGGGSSMRKPRKGETSMKKGTDASKLMEKFKTQIDMIPINIRKSLSVKKKYGGGLKDVPPGDKGKGLSKLPAPVRNKMGFKKKGGAMKMRGGGLAIQGLGFRGVR